MQVPASRLISINSDAPAARLKVAKTLPGLIDAGASSLATFIIGVAAIRLMPPSAVGAYALIFSAWVFISKLPLRLVLVPAEARLVKASNRERIAAFRHNARLSLPLLGLVMAIMWSVGLLIPEEVPNDTAMSLLSTAVAVAVLVPLQEHGRQLLHLARRHWQAAAVSVLRLLTTSLAMLIGLVTNVPTALLPFGALALGDLAVVVAVTAISFRVGEYSPPYSVRQLVPSGRWLLLGGSFAPAAGFIVSVAVAHLAGATALGVAEAARVAAQPILVLALGFMAVLRPSSMEEAIRGRRREATDLTNRFLKVLGGSCLVYGLVTFLPESTNPLALLLPTAFSVTGLVQLSVLAAFFNGAILLYKSELIATDRVRPLSYAEGAGASSQVVLSLSAPYLREWTVPASFLVGGLVRWLFVAKFRRDIYTIDKGADHSSFFDGQQ